MNKMGIPKKMEKRSPWAIQEKAGMKWMQCRTSGKDGMLLHYVLFGGSMAQ